MWRRDLQDIQDYGTPVLLTSEPDVPDAFAVRIHDPVNGALADPGGRGFLVAYGNACTHMGCLLFGDCRDRTLLDYQQAQVGSSARVLCGPCRCHGTTFDLRREGLVVFGPATQNLPQLELRLSEDGLAIEADRWQFQQDPRIEAWPE